MKLKYIFPAVVFSMIAGGAYAQYAQDALRFSRFEQGSTSRIKAIGNASTAVGGDLSSISRNPAGLGFFNSSELSFTPEFNGSAVRGSYLGDVYEDNKNNFNFNNASVVFNTKTTVPRGYATDKGLLSFNFGLSWNRTNNFYDNVSYGGYNETSSVADFYLQQANRFGLNDSPQDLAYQQYLIDDDGEGGFVATPYWGSEQSMVQVDKGGQNEFSLALGANFSNKLYLGFGAGFTSLRYESYASFREIGEAAIYEETSDSYEDVGYDTYYDIDRHTTGSGFNFRLGLIYKPVEAVRLGATFTSPTWYSIEDRTSYIVDTKYSTQDDWYSGGPSDYNYDYNLRTPLKVAGGVAVFFQQMGFISADVEYVDYAGMKITNSSTSSIDNRTISDLYQSTVNARIGAEGRLDNNFYLRAGYNYLGNPEKEIGSATQSVSGGLGYRLSRFYIDATYTNVFTKQHTYPYEIGAESPEAELKRTYDNVYLTVGFRF